MNVLLLQHGLAARPHHSLVQQWGIFSTAVLFVLLLNNARAGVHVCMILCTSASWASPVFEVCAALGMVCWGSCCVYVVCSLQLRLLCVWSAAVTSVRRSAYKSSLLLHCIYL